MGFIAKSRAQPVSRGLLVILRIYLGFVFLLAVSAKLGSEPSFSARLPVILERVGASAHPFYQRFLAVAVVPRPALFASAVIVLEIVVGLSLLLGAVTRVGAALAMFLLLNYMFLKGAWLWTPSSNDAAFFVIGLVLLVGAAGRAFGVDYFLARRWPRLPWW